jgi:hypothetical protein
MKGINVSPVQYRVTPVTEGVGGCEVIAASSDAVSLHPNIDVTYKV